MQTRVEIVDNQAMLVFGTHSVIQGRHNIIQPRGQLLQCAAGASASALAFPAAFRNEVLLRAVPARALGKLRVAASRVHLALRSFCFIAVIAFAFVFVFVLILGDGSDAGWPASRVKEAQWEGCGQKGC